MKAVATIGLNIAKQVFQVRGAEKSGRPALRWGDVVGSFSEIPPYLIGIEASSCAYFSLGYLHRPL